MLQDEHTTEEEQSKQKHAVTPMAWYQKKNNSKVITFWWISDPTTKSERNFYIQKARQFDRKVASYLVSQL